MLSLAASDLLYSSILMPLGTLEIAENGKWILGDGLCAARLTLHKIMCSVSVYHVTTIALDKYIAICKPCCTGS
ncbi:unnamed protein product [Lymnaea stagnalis]|uniref:G-protein coupled receptors family 1 profile domain-containing protein n=1 Tax=Lymnaea stagnalis TaxID=6523 RepID=A0AAV2HGV0_LYMST